MNLKEKTKFLSSLSVFSGLNEQSLAQVCKLFREETIPPKNLFITEDSMGEKAYFVVSGLVRVFHTSQDGKETTINLRANGEVVGEMSLIEYLPRSANVETVDQTIFLTLNKQDFNNLLDSIPKVSINFLKLLSQRIREDLKFQIVRENSQLQDRTLELLQRLSIIYPNTEIPLSHEEISSLINATQPRVTEALHTLETNNKIALSRRKITLLN